MKKFIRKYWYAFAVPSILIKCCWIPSDNPYRAQFDDYETAISVDDEILETPSTDDLESKLKDEMYHSPTLTFDDDDTLDAEYFLDDFKYDPSILSDELTSISDDMIDFEDKYFLVLGELEEISHDVGDLNADYNSGEIDFTEYFTELGELTQDAVYLSEERKDLLDDFKSIYQKFQDIRWDIACAEQELLGKKLTLRIDEGPLADMYSDFQELTSDAKETALTIYDFSEEYGVSLFYLE
jgi:hypothetical protein